MERWATFDCYGTLIDWNGGIARELARVFGDADLLARYHELEPVVQAEDPAASYRSVLGEVLHAGSARRPARRTGWRGRCPAGCRSRRCRTRYAR